ncbi:PP2C family protein-serine/threonine phosphatase [Sphaerisporangium sp. NPDC005289]|uniref:PP2C family protein-serine/threonine phosphatase n=1 Tax=Sphaerisporangium sp. NPDC005289 TaxID=3155247 RepID=UPI0033B5DEA1
MIARKLSAGAADLMAELMEAGHFSGLEMLPELLAEHAPGAGMRDILVYLVDLQQENLHLLPYPEDQPLGPCELRVDGTLAGKAFQQLQVLPKTGEDGRPEWWWAPLLDGTERLGVMRVSVDQETEWTQADIRCLASTVALLVASKSAHSDTYARLVRTRAMSVTAEMQWNLMPPLSFANDEVVIAAALEPAYDISGDAFDYGLAGDTLHLAMYDAMGHDASAGLTATLAVAACRSHRHQGKDLASTVEAIEDVLMEEFGTDERFATAVLANLDVPSGLLTWINCGHHPPVLIRDGHWVATLDCRPSHPLGLYLGLPLVTCQEQLQPGDRVLLYTDGITEARNEHGQEFGLPRFVDFVIRSAMDALPVQETLRRLIRNVLTYHDQRMEDDATVMLVEWHGPRHPTRERPSLLP